MLSFVVAISKNGEIGSNNKLAWHLPSDARYFKEVTLTGSKTMIMGRKTFESLPKVLPGRKHIVLTTDKSYAVNNENVLVFHNLEDILAYLDPDEEHFVIGGAEIFKLFFSYTDRMYLTIIDEKFVGDTFFPDYDESDWKTIKQWDGTVDSKNRYKHTFIIKERIR